MDFADSRKVPGIMVVVNSKLIALVQNNVARFGISGGVVSRKTLTDRTYFFHMGVIAHGYGERIIF